jgi:hypothetical protein
MTEPTLWRHLQPGDLIIWRGGGKTQCVDLVIANRIDNTITLTTIQFLFSNYEYKGLPITTIANASELALSIDHVEVIQRHM